PAMPATSSTAKTPVALQKTQLRPAPGGLTVVDDGGGTERRLSSAATAGAASSDTGRSDVRGTGGTESSVSAPSRTARTDASWPVMSADDKRGMKPDSAVRPAVRSAERIERASA